MTEPEEMSLRNKLLADPDNIHLRFSLAYLYQERGSLEDAVHEYKKILELRSDLTDVYINLGNTLDALGKTEEALAMLNRALSLEPESFSTNLNVGNIMFKLNNLVGAETFMRQALKANPHHFVVNYNLANILQAQQQLAEAIRYYELAIHLDPTVTAAHNNLGNTYKKIGNASSAIRSYQKAVELDPGNSMALGNLGGLYIDIRELEKARSACLRALQSDPRNIDAFDNLLFALNYDNSLSEKEVFQSHLEWNRHFGHDDQADVTWSGRMQNTRTIRRIGFVSGDFRNHSVSYFFEPLLGAIQRADYTIFCYSNVEKEDEVTDRIRNKADGWRSILGLSDVEASQMIKADEVDILIDLSGHTSGNRLLLFSLKPAPIQASWLGYPNTTGSAAIDFRLTDDIADPIGESDQLHCETLLRMESGFLCYQPGCQMVASTSLPFDENGHIRFGSFNNISKITNQVVHVWSMILVRLPESRIVLKSKTFSDEAVKDKLLSEFAEYGVEKNRVVLLPHVDGYESHMRLYESIDIALDTFPYNGTTTTCEALWMRVPVISLNGDSHRSRVSKSILHRIGLDALCYDTATGYVDGAVALANSQDQLRALRSTMRERMSDSPLCNPKDFAANFTKSCEEMLLRKAAHNSDI